MKFYVARDENGDLFLYNHLPKRAGNLFTVDRNTMPYELVTVNAMQIDSKMFPEVTWETGAMEVEINQVIQYFSND